MSGHSKWSKVKHQKETSDTVKGKVFTKLSNALIIAVKQGGGNDDPESNFKLRLAIEKARNFNMPKDKIERAITRAKGSGGEETLNEIIYEAFGPGGVGIIIETATSNKQRTVADLKNVLERGGGVLATTGAVSYLFKQLGLINVNKIGKTFDEVMEAAINAGALDIEDTTGYIEVYTQSADLHKVKEVLKARGIPIISFELFYRPVTTVAIQNNQIALQILQLLSNLEELDDVQKVYANFDIPDEYLTKQ